MFAEKAVRVADLEATSDTPDMENVPYWERLRYTLFQLAFTEMFDGIKQCEHIIKDMDEQSINAMCDHAGVTVKKAYENARMNMVMKMLPKPLRDLLG